MVTLPEPIEFEWDEGNREKNENKHGITTKEAEEVFNNEPKFLFPDESHSQQENRYGMYGRTNADRYVSLVFTIRKKLIRIITIRPMSKKERRVYEKIKTDTAL